MWNSLCHDTFMISIASISLNMLNEASVNFLLEEEMVHCCSVVTLSVYTQPSSTVFITLNWSKSSMFVHRDTSCMDDSIMEVVKLRCTCMLDSV